MQGFVRIVLILAASRQWRFGPGPVRHMRASGVTFRKEAGDEELFRYVMCEAPDGTLLELYEVRTGSEWTIAKHCESPPY